MTAKSNQSISKRILMFCGSVLVTGTAVVSFSGEASARGRNINAGPLWNDGHANSTCPRICRQNGLRWTGDWATTIPNTMSVCGCGEWRLRGSAPAPIQQLTDTEQRKYDQFKNAIAHRGLSPAEAAAELGTPNAVQFKRLGNSQQYQIRISQGRRVTFLIHTGTKEVQILQAGGHT